MHHLEYSSFCHKDFPQCCFDVVSTSSTSTQHLNNIGGMPCVCSALDYFCLQKQATDSVAYLVSQLSHVDQQGLPILLKEIKGICDLFSTVLAEFMPEIDKYSQNVTVTTRIIVQQLKDLCNKR